MCYPSDCGSPQFYPGSPLTLPTNNVASEITKKIVGGTRLLILLVVFFEWKILYFFLYEEFRKQFLNIKKHSLNKLKYTVRVAKSRNQINHIRCL